MGRVFVTWVPFSSRTHLLARAFNARPYYIKYLTKRTLFRTLIRYFLATFHTLFTLYRSKPSVIFLMNQPVFLPIIVFCYSKITKSHYILDSHSGLFNKRVWRSFIPVMKHIYRDCSLNIAHNDHDAARYRAWGARTVVLGTEVYPYESYGNIALETTKNVVVIGTFGDDEPTDATVSAAAVCKDVYFYFTGSVDSATRKLGRKELPRNIILTGFLPLEKFIGLVKSADVALVLVTTENTMQMAAWEAMSCDTPVILSDSELLRSTFPKGAVFVKNTKQGIQEGIHIFFKNRIKLKEEIIELKLEKTVLWENEVKTIKNILSSYG
jgi:glycosyltransferase involved in cell wall biosynthesis